MVKCPMVEATVETTEIPLFPLRTVLFPGGQLPLRIFEPRYVDMISRCMREQAGFGVVLIRNGPEARSQADDQQPDVFDVGTLANIVDFNALADGLLGIVGVGDRKFQIREFWERTDHLLMGRVSWLADEREQNVREADKTLVDILVELMKHPMVERLELNVDLEDARSLGWRLSELLPIEPEIKQSLLQMNLPYERLAELNRLVNKLRA